MRNQEAEVIALRAVEWLARADEHVLARFFALTGASLADFARVAEDEDFPLMVLEFVLGEDERVIAFCDYCDYDYDLPHWARLTLAGRSDPHWT